MYYQLHVVQSVMCSINLCHLRTKAPQWSHPAQLQVLASLAKGHRDLAACLPIFSCLFWFKHIVGWSSWSVCSQGMNVKLMSVLSWGELRGAGYHSSSSSSSFWEQFKVHLLVWPCSVLYSKRCLKGETVSIPAQMTNVSSLVCLLAPRYFTVWTGVT